MKFFLIAVYSLILLFIISCNDDFDINGEWQNIPVVYGILDHTDSAHYIRINKAFLGDGDVYEMAQISDSLYYSGEVKVRFIEYNLPLIGGNYPNPFYSDNWQETGNVYELYPTTEIEKDSVNNYGESATFATDDHVLFKTKQTLRRNYKYKLEIEVPGKDEFVTAETFMPDTVRIDRFTDPVHPTISVDNEANPFKLTWSSSNYGKIYQMYILFHYYEIYNGDTTLQTAKLSYETQFIYQIKTPNEVIGTDITQKIGGARFFQLLSSQVQPLSGVKRVFNYLDIVIVSGGNNFYNYLNISETTVGFGQEPPEYSNIINGVGLFGARSHSQFVGGDKITFNGFTSSLDSLAKGRFTKNLGFSRFDADSDPGFSDN